MVFNIISKFMKLKYLPLIGVVLMAACSAASADDAYTVTVPMPPKANGQQAFLVNYDNGDKIDSVKVESGKAVFKGAVSAPVMARIMVGGDRFGSLILENAPIVVNRGGAVDGGKLNAELANCMRGIQALQAEAAKLPQDSTFEQRMAPIKARYDAYMDSVITANVENPIGYLFFVEEAYGLDLPTLRQQLDRRPQMKRYARTTKLLQALEQKQKTMPGNKFIDFEVKNDSTVQRFSDYVGRGKYTLVDFWASWCGPCIRETKVIKEILEENKDKNFEVLGVAVWDEPEKTLRAIKAHQLPWPQIINAQSVPTDLYGISGIPCIMLIGPDGTILTRDLQGDELKAAVRAALDPSAPK